MSTLISRTETLLSDGRVKIISKYSYNGNTHTREYIKVKKEESKKRGPKVGSKHKPDPNKLLRKLEEKRQQIEEDITRLRVLTIQAPQPIILQIPVTTGSDNSSN